MRVNCSRLLFLVAVLLLQFAYSGDLELRPPTELVRWLRYPDDDIRLKAERDLLRWKADAAEALLHATCRKPTPDPNVVAATRRILTAWERDSWTNPQSAAAIDRFVELARDPRSTSGQDVPLGPNAAIPFATLVRVLDVTPDAAAAFLSERPGIKVSKDGNGFYRSITLGSQWVVEPRDWLYIASLPRVIRDSTNTNDRCRLYIHVVASLDSDTLAECLRNLRKLIDSPISLLLSQARLDRECLLVLRSYRKLTMLDAYQWDEDIPDEFWATSISAWPNCHSLVLSTSASTKAIMAASRLKNLLNLKLMNSALTERDLTPLRGHKKLNTLWVKDAEAAELRRTHKSGWEKAKPYIEYLNQQGTGKWQAEQADRNDD